jgi:hypothetical protein
MEIVSRHFTDAAGFAMHLDDWSDSVEQIGAREALEHDKFLLSTQRPHVRPRVIAFVRISARNVGRVESWNEVSTRDPKVNGLCLQLWRSNIR